MATNIDYVCSDNHTSISFTIKDSSGTVVNITGCTIKLSIRKEGASTNTNDSANQCSLDAPTSGIFSYKFNTGDCPTSGQYNAQLTIQFPDTSIHRVPRFITITAIESYL